MQHNIVRPHKDGLKRGRFVIDLDLVELILLQIVSHFRRYPGTYCVKKSGLIQILVQRLLRGLGYGILTGFP